MEKEQKEIPALNINLAETNSPKAACGLQFQRLEGNLCQIEKLKSPHRNMFYEILFIKNGSGYQTIDFNTFAIQKNTFYFISEGQIQSWELSETVEGYSVFFTREFYDLWSAQACVFDFSFFHTSYVFSFLTLSNLEQEAEFEDFFESFEKEFRKDSGTNQEKINWSYLNILLYKLQQNYKESPFQYSKYNYRTIRSFEVLVQKNFRQIRGVADYANMLHISPNYLNALCKKAEGKHAKEIINDRVLLEAKRLLYNSTKGITEIAFALKFKDASYFSRFFRKGTGMSPEEFRMGYLQEILE